jgi:hypothetical protein
MHDSNIKLPYVFTRLQLPILLQVSLLFVHFTYTAFPLYVLFSIIVLLSSSLMLYFCVCISKFVFQLPRCNNINLFFFFMRGSLKILSSTRFVPATQFVSCVFFWIL